MTHPPETLSHAEQLKKLADLVKDIRVTMFTTFDAKTGKPHARPMYTQKLDAETFTGSLWFLSDIHSGKVDELNANPAVLLTYADPGKNRFVTVTGTADAERDPAKAKELWNVHAKGWWPGGPDDPNLGIIRVDVAEAEYWDGPSQLSYLFSLVKAVATGNRVQTTAEHGVMKP
jgi:general stress protein 26